ncbi:SRPBCC family protein [Dietzia sp.]|uniref:SRPBCC family protein n=1 Tax=Dietzia sp. TaxID=1871616 RepID=UPI002FD8AB81
MGKVRARNEASIDAPAATVADRLASYQLRPEIQPEQYSAYRVVSGGNGEGTIAAWHLQATKKRSRDVQVNVSESGDRARKWTLTESDQNSTLVTTYTVTDKGDNVSTLVVESTWDGAKGIGGFFERTFAPGGLQKIQQAQIDLLRERL